MGWLAKPKHSPCGALQPKHQKEVINMKFILSLFFASIIATSASAVTIVPVENQICTRDLNLWGQPSRCSCPDEVSYDQRIGKCVIGEVEPIVVSGELLTGVSAIGGETTGFVLSDANRGDFELILTRPLRAEFSELDTSGTMYQIEGEYVLVEGIEIPERPTIIVTGIKPLLR